MSKNYQQSLENLKKRIPPKFQEWFDSEEGMKTQKMVLEQAKGDPKLCYLAGALMGWMASIQVEVSDVINSNSNKLNNRGCSSS